MNRRNLLKVAPLAALAPIALKTIGQCEVRAVELTPGKRYVFVFSDARLLDQSKLEHFQETLKRSGIQGVAICGDPDLKIYELT